MHAVIETHFRHFAPSYSYLCIQHLSGGEVMHAVIETHFRHFVPSYSYLCIQHLSGGEVMHAVIETHFRHPVVLGQELVKLKHTTFKHRTRLVALCKKIIPIVSLDATSSYATASVLNLGHYGFRGGASLQIENAQLKLHFSSCMLVLSFEWMNILQPTLCVVLFHAFESSIIFEKPSFYGLSGRPRAVDRFPKRHCFGWLSSNSSYRRKWRRTRLKLYSQSEERTLFRAVYELFWCGLWKQRNGGKYGCCNFFLKYFVKIGRLGKKFTHRLILCSFIYKSMYFTSGFVEKYDGNGLKTMTMWQKNLSNSACASRGFVGLQIKRDGGDLKIQSSSHLSAVKALKLKLNTLTWGIFGWYVYSIRYLVKVYKSLGIVLGTFHLQLLVTPASVMAAPRVLFIGPGFWLRAGLFL